MADIIVAGNTSGAITISAPSVAGSGTLTLPTGTDTLVGKATTDTLTNKTLGTGTVFPAGAVLQVVQGTFNTSTTTTSTSLVTTGFSVSITPKFNTSKVLVQVNGGKTYCPASSAMGCYMYRNGSTLGASLGFAYETGGTSPVGSPHSFSYLDSPATTSSTTYTPYFKSLTGSTVYFADAPAVYTVTMTLMEIQG